MSGLAGRRPLGGRDGAPDVCGVQPPGLALDQARSRVDEAIAALAVEYGLECRWHDAVLAVHRPGFEGFIEVAARHVTVEIRLGFLLRPLRDRISEGVASSLARLLDAPPAEAAPNRGDGSASGAGRAAVIGPLPEARRDRRRR